MDVYFCLMFCNDHWLTQLLEPDQPIKIRPHLEKMDIHPTYPQILSLIFIFTKFHLSLHTTQNVLPSPITPWRYLATPGPCLQPTDI